MNITKAMIEENTMMIWLRLVTMCWWRGCGGFVDYDKRGVYWRCATCGKETR